MKILKNKKILFILVAFLFCLFVFSGSSKANFYFTYNNQDYIFPSLPDMVRVYNFNFFIKYSEEYSKYVLYVSETQENLIFCVSDDLRKGWVNPAGICYATFHYNSSEFKWEKYSSSGNVDGHTTFFNGTENLNLSDFIMYSSCDIYDEKGNKLFPVAPQKAEAVEIPTIQEAQQIPEIITKVIKMIIPVCLVILATLLLISLIQSVIYRTL